MTKSFFTVGIGASAGGLPALIEFFDQIPDHMQVAFVVIMHLIRDHRSLLNEVLCRHTSLPLIRLESDMMLEVGNIYLIIENTTLTVKDGCFRVSPRGKSKVNSSVNIFFESLAVDFREMSIGIILSGAGDDGLKGSRKIKEMGGTVLVQDPNSAEITGMPLSIIASDRPAEVSNPTNLARSIIRLCTR